MRIYVYQVSDTEYHAGLVERVCRSKGRIVESWPVDTVRDMDYLISHGSNFGKVSDEVVQLAERVKAARGHIEPIQEEAKEAAYLEICGLSFLKRVRFALKIIFRG